MGATTAWREVALIPWQRLRQRGSPAWPLGAALLGLVGPPLLLLAFGRRNAAVAAVPVLASLLIVIAWCSFVSALLLQNQPVAARLVPGNVQQLRRVLIGGWGLAALLLGGVVVSGLGLALALAWALGLVALAWALRWPQLWSVLWVVPAFSWWWMTWPPLQAAARAWQAGSAAQPLAATLATLALAVVLLPGVVQNGDAAHQRNHRRLRDWRSAADSTGLRGRKGWAQDGWLGLLRRRAMGLYRAWLHRLCARPGSPPMARAMLALGPSAHWTGQASAAVVVALGTGLLLATLRLFGVTVAEGFTRGHLIGPALGLMSFAINPLLQVRMAMHQSRREQALLVLLPGVPRGAALNRALAWRLTGHFLTAWALAGALSLALVGPSGTAIVAQAAVFGSLPFVALFWRDWSRTPEPGPGTVGAVVLMVVAAVLALLALRWTTGAGAGVVGLCSVALTLGLGVWRWRVLGRCRSAWPTGRSAAQPGR